MTSSSKTSYQRSFLPHEVMECHEKCNKWGIKSTAFQMMRNTVKEMCGFDETGQHYTLFQRLDAEDTKWYRYQVVSYRYIEKLGRLRKTFIQIDAQNIIDVDGAVYDPYRNHWFLAQSPNSHKDGFQYGHFTICSGSLKDMLTKHQSIKATEKGQKLVIPIPKTRYTQTFQIQRDNKEGDLLVICSFSRENQMLILDLVKYNEKLLIHHRRISVSTTDEPRLCRKIKVSLDCQSELLYFLDKHKEAEHQIKAFDFSGQKLFETSLLNVGQDTMDEPISYITHLHHCIFAFFYMISRQVIILKVDQTGYSILNQFEHFTPPMESKALFNYEPKLIRIFGDYHLCTEQLTNSHNCVISLTDLRTGKNTFHYNTLEDYHPYQMSSISWNEIAFLGEARIPEFEPFFRRKEPVNFLKIVKIHPGPFGLNLKHAARLSCLRWFSENYLNQNLPVCLRKYLGVWKEY